MFPRTPLPDRLKASCDVSMPIVGPGASETGCRATCASGTCMAEAGGCSAVSHPHPELLDIRDMAS